jgi:hypothetical protein
MVVKGNEVNGISSHYYSQKREFINKDIFENGLHKMFQKFGAFLTVVSLL